MLTQLDLFCLGGHHMWLVMALISQPAELELCRQSGHQKVKCGCWQLVVVKTGQTCAQ